VILIEALGVFNSCGWWKKTPTTACYFFENIGQGGKSMTEIGFLIGNKKAESFALQLDEILLK